MLIDDLTKISDEQAITVTAASESYIDTLAAGNAIGEQQYMEVVVDTAFTAGGSATMTIALQTDTDAGFATALETKWTSSAIAVATLVAGYKVRIPIPLGMKRYWRLYFTIATGPMTAGNLSAYIADGVDVSVND